MNSMKKGLNTFVSLIAIILAMPLAELPVVLLSGSISLMKISTFLVLVTQ